MQEFKGHSSQVKESDKLPEDAHEYLNIDALIRNAKREYKRAWREKNREHLRQYYREYRKRNKEKIAEQNKKFWVRKALTMNTEDKE